MPSVETKQGWDQIVQVCTGAPLSKVNKSWAGLALSACFTYFKLVMNLQNSRPRPTTIELAADTYGRIWQAAGGNCSKSCIFRVLIKSICGIGSIGNWKWGDWWVRGSIGNSIWGEELLNILDQSAVLKSRNLPSYIRIWATSLSSNIICEWPWWVFIYVPWHLAVTYDCPVGSIYQKNVKTTCLALFWVIYTTYAWDWVAYAAYAAYAT